MKFLDINGVRTLWSKIKETFVSKRGGGEIIATSSKPFSLSVDLTEDYGDATKPTLLKIGGIKYDDSLYLGSGSHAVRFIGEVYFEHNLISLRGNPDIEWNDTTINTYHLNIDKLVQDGYLTE